MLHDPFALLGLHERDGRLFITTLWPAAQRCRIEPRLDGPAVELLRQSDGFFRADLGQKPRFDYRVIFVTPDAEIRFERDPYNHGLLLSDWDLPVLPRVGIIIWGTFWVRRPLKSAVLREFVLRCGRPMPSG